MNDPTPELEERLDQEAKEKQLRHEGRLHCLDRMKDAVQATLAQIPNEIYPHRNIHARSNLFALLGHIDALKTSLEVDP